MLLNPVQGPHTIQLQLERSGAEVCCSPLCPWHVLYSNSFIFQFVLYIKMLFKEAL